LIRLTGSWFPVPDPSRILAYPTHHLAHSALKNPHLFCYTHLSVTHSTSLSVYRTHKSTHWHTTKSTTRYFKW
jgi:hypothetical protein